MNDGGSVPARRGNGEGSIYRRTSDGRWLGAVVLGYAPTGHQRRKTVSGRTRAEVVSKLRDLQRNLDDGLPAPDTRVTIAQLIERWHHDIIRHQVAPSASENYRSIAAHHIVPTLGRKRVAQLTPAHVDALISQKIDSGLSVSTVRRIRSVLSQALDQAIRWGLVNRNVVALTRGPKQQRRSGRTLSPVQARHLLAALDGHRNEALYTLMLSTGLRRGEALGLYWQDIDFGSGVLNVTRQLKREGGSLITRETKTARSRRAINLPSPMTALLRVHKARQAAERLAMGEAWHETGFVFVSAVGTPIDPRNLYREFRSICLRAGLGGWHPHELRHSAASLMLAQGVKIQVVSEILGHSSIRMTADVYGHILDPDRQSAADAMGAVLWS